MTELLIKLFVKNNKDTKNTKVRLAYGNLAGIVGILCNVLLFAGKYIIGTLFGSIAIAADAVNNLSDASSNIVSLLGFKLGSKKQMRSIRMVMRGMSIWRDLWSVSLSWLSACHWQKKVF